MEVISVINCCVKITSKISNMKGQLFIITYAYKILEMISFP